MPQLNIREDDSKEDEISEKGDDADDQDGQADIAVHLKLSVIRTRSTETEKKDTLVST